VKTLRCRIKGYIQPFERILALRELHAVAETAPEAVKQTSGTPPAEYTIRTTQSAKSVASRLSYWEAVSHGETEFVTDQSLRESTVNVVRNGIDLSALKKLLPFEDDVPLPNRRCLRYGTHGIHEYRGKFFPQLVRSLINISGMRPGGIVSDPMVGSGTTAVEARLFGCVGLGLDMNPLSIFIARTKCELLEADTKKLEMAYQSVRSAVLEPEERSVGKRAYFSMLPPEDQTYLTGWFASEVLDGMDDIAQAIQRVKYDPARNLMWVALSNIVRSVSWQKDDDLRVRKEVRLDVEIDPKKEFLEELARSIRAVLAFLYQNGPVKGCPYSIEDADARDSAKVWSKHKNKIDVVITSPPYATALPYLDTDRLSLCYLSLLPRPEHRVRDQRMIGNREVTDRLRRDYWARFEAHAAQDLPASVRSLIAKIDKLNHGTDVGFRRRNLPALLSKYFFDMHDVLAGVRAVLKPGGHAFIVVGNNHTIAGGQRVDIQTAGLLSDIAAALCLDVCDSVSMEMLVSRDIFKKNALGSEDILHFRRRR
jgi:DNA modification methylase